MPIPGGGRGMRASPGPQRRSGGGLPLARLLVALVRLRARRRRIDGRRPRRTHSGTSPSTATRGSRSRPAGCGSTTCSTRPSSRPFTERHAVTNHPQPVRAAAGRRAATFAATSPSTGRRCPFGRGPLARSAARPGRAQDAAGGGDLRRRPSCRSAGSSAPPPVRRSQRAVAHRLAGDRGRRPSGHADHLVERAGP